MHYSLHLLLKTNSLPYAQTLLALRNSLILNDITASNLDNPNRFLSFSLLSNIRLRAKDSRLLFPQDPADHKQSVHLIL